VVGLVAALTLVALDREVVATPTTPRDLGYVLRTKVLPMAVVLAVVAGVGLAAVAVARARGLARPTAVLLPALVLAFAGTGLAPTATHAFSLVTGRSAARPQQPPMIDAGGIRAARWLRAHAAPDDLVATNAHCATPDADPQTSGCDPRHFWMAAYSERQFLVEGWAYVPQEVTGPDGPVETSLGPYWDPALLALNDTAFQQPTPAALDALEEHDVRWLLVDERYPVDLAGLETQAHRRFAAGHFTVLRLD